MARTRKSHATGEEAVKKPKGQLPPPYGKSGDNPYVVYADLKRENDVHARVLILCFKAPYAANKFIRLLIHNDTWEPTDPIGSRKAIITSTGVRISMFKDDLEWLVKYEPTAAEAEWTDEIMQQQVLRFKYGAQEGAEKKDEDDASTDGEVLQSSGATKTKSKRKEPRAAKEPKVKVDKSGYVSANDLAEKHKLIGREIRGILRASKLTKPDIGWMWAKDSPELKEATKIIEDGVKALAKKKSKK